MTFKRKISVVAALVAFVLMVGSAPAMAGEHDSAGQMDAATSQKKQEIRGGNGQNCASSSKIKIRVDGSNGDYTLNDNGELVPGAAVPTFSGCSVKASKESARTAIQAVDSTFSYTFGPYRTTYSASDSNSTFWAQQSYSTGLTTAYRWEPSAYVRSIIYGDALQAYAFKSPDNCSYNKPGYDADYIFHWSCTGQSNLHVYYLWGQWSFRAAGPGWSGYADITWDFDYQIAYV